MKATVAGAPVSFGVFELTPEGQETLGPDEMLEILVETGYAGVDLGPLGFFGEDAALRTRLDSFGMALAGGWIQLPFSHEDFDACLPQLHEALRAFSAAAEGNTARLPLPTLADDGSSLRQAAPGRGEQVDRVTEEAWQRLAANAQRAAEIVRAAGFEPTFHHHAGTFVESASEIDRFLAETDIGLTLDTGHLFVAGADPVEAARLWGARINHLHLKDVDAQALQCVLRGGGGMREVWSSRSFVAFGEGDVDLDAVMRELDAHDYDGWIVVEQDVLNPPGLALADFRAARAADQETNRAALRPWA